MDFHKDVYILVRKIPKGKVATYGQIAAMISSPRAARMIGVALRSLPEGSQIPWQRVINSKGFISIDNMDHPAEEQANLLIAEGIEVRKVGNSFHVDLDKYLWDFSKIVDKDKH